MKPTLVILAAGVGSRYGGLKQLDKVGPGGAALMDYTIYDAIHSGYGKIVLVIQRKTEDEIRAHIEAGAGKHIEVAYAHQEMSSLPEGFLVPPGRVKPWGTGQAVLVAAPHLDGPFVVANADDYYGREPLEALHEYLNRDFDDGLAHWAMVGYRLGDTLPLVGEVSRALCVQDIDGWMVALEEVPAIERDGEIARWVDANGTEHEQSLDSLVSMNLWGFTRELVGHLQREFREFLVERPAPSDEYYLPLAVAGALSTGNARVSVLPAGVRWCGMTSPEDREITVAVLRELVKSGKYPERLWG